MNRLMTAACAALLALPAMAQEGGVENPSRNEYRGELEGKKVVYVPMNMTSDATLAWARAIENQAEELGYSVETRDPAYNTEVGARAISAAISERPDLIVLQNPDVQSYARLIRQATSQGIKVVQLNMESMTPSDYYVGADWIGIGYIAGREIAKRCKPGEGPSNKVQFVMGVPTSALDMYLINGFKQALDEVGGIEIVSQQAAAYDPTKARSITASVLQQHPDLCGSFGVWDSMDTGTGAAIKEAGKSDQVFVVTSGAGASTACEKIREGIWDMEIAWDARLQGTALNVVISDTLQSPMEAGAETRRFFTPNRIITRENMTEGSCWEPEDIL